MQKKGYLVLIAAAVVLSPPILAENAASSASISLAKPLIADTSAAAMTGSSPDASSMETMVKNMARWFQNRVSPSGVRYWSLVDSDLKGKTPDQMLQRLSPPAIQEGGRVRMDVVVDLKEPLTIFARPGQSISIGTALVDGAGTQSITVTSIISTNGLTIISK